MNNMCKSDSVGNVQRSYMIPNCTSCQVDIVKALVLGIYAQGQHFLLAV